MTPTTMSLADELLREHQQSVYRRTDKMFGILLVFQWMAGVVAALWISPTAWSGTDASLHPHVIAAIAFGGLITALPVYLAAARPGHVLTRHIIAISQMIFSGLLIHLTGGRIETHFHVFGSLAFLACYRDWRVLVTATIVVVLDHLVRGLVWPYSVYGVLTAPMWRSLEHGSWVLFEDVFLIVAIRQSVTEMRNVADAIQAKSEVAAELHRSQADLLKQTQILESILTSMGDGVIVADRDGRFLVFNPAAQQILGKGATSDAYEQWSDTYGLFKADGVTPIPLAELPMVRAIAGESSDNVDIFVRPQDSEAGNWISVTGRPLRGTEGELLGGVVVFRDVTTAKQSEELMQNAREAAESASLAKTQFLANISHEIRTPLGSILGFADLLRRGIGTSSDHETYLESIRSSGRHLSALIDDLLDLSKIEAGRMEYEHIRCSPHQIISEVLSVLRVRAQQKSLELDCVWESGVPETILTDPARVRQLLMNLVGNAIKFTEHGHVTLTASIQYGLPHPQLTIEVRDTGIGITPDRAESVFNPFEQADSSITRRFGGTGLGLSISRHIAQGLGGSISLSSEPGRGSVFRVELPTGPLDGIRILAQPSGEAISTSAQTDVSIAAQLSGYRILLVEDGASNQQLISLVLREAGAQVTTASNGREGVELAREQPFDLILMDMQMPVMDGYTATQRLRDSGCSLPIIALTAHAMRGDREKCLEAGCTGYLSKPLNIDDLIQTVSAVISETPRQHASEWASSSAPLTSASEPIKSTLTLDDNQLRSIIERFIEQLHEMHTDVRSALVEQDWQRLATFAHWLRGSGGLVGFDCFTGPAARLQQAARAQQAAESEAALAEIGQLADRLAVAV